MITTHVINQLPEQIRSEFGGGVASRRYGGYAVVGTRDQIIVQQTHTVNTVSIPLVFCGEGAVSYAGYKGTVLQFH